MPVRIDPCGVSRLLGKRSSADPSLQAASRGRAGITVASQHHTAGQMLTPTLAFWTPLAFGNTELIGTWLAGHLPVTHMCCTYFPTGIGIPTQRPGVLALALDTLWMFGHTPTWKRLS